MKKLQLLITSALLLVLLTVVLYAQSLSNRWAILDSHNKVINVVVASSEIAATYIQNMAVMTPNATTCISTTGNSIVQAGIGDTYDTANHVFITPKPYPSWILNTTTFIWEAPVAKPAAVAGSFYLWNEKTKSWISMVIPAAVTTNNSAK